MKDESKKGEHPLSEQVSLDERRSDLEGSTNRLGQGGLEDEERHRMLLGDVLDASPVGIIVLDNRFLVTRVNRALERFFGLRREELVGRDKRMLVDERIKHIMAAPEIFAERVLAAYKENSCMDNFECRVLPDGEREERWLEYWSQPIRGGLYDGGRVEHYFDITGRKRAADELKVQKAYLEKLIESAPEAIAVLDPRDCVVKINRGFTELFGYGHEEARGRPINELVAPPHLLDEAKRFSHIAMGGGTVKAESVRRRADGTLVHVAILGTPILGEDGPSGIYAIYQDITDRKKAEEERRISEEKMRLIIEASPIGIRIVQHDRYVYANPACVTMYGYDSAEEILGLPVEALYAPEDREVIRGRRRARLAGEQVPAFYEAQGIKKGGECFDIAVWVAVIDYQGEPAVLTFVVDTSAEKTLRAQLLQAQKMEAIGTLAGGVAHDFNNLLQAVQGYAELLLLNKRREESGHRELQEIIRAARRGGELTRQLLTFSRKLESRLRPVDLNREVQEIYKFLTRTIPKMIEIRLHLADDLKTVHADPVQIEQVIMNLAINAKDAMPAGGSLTIETRNVRLDRRRSRRHQGLKPGRYCLLVMSDTGHGMDEETLEHVFEPFFTTKGVGRGTGLGLATVYGIVKSHGGHVMCTSEPGVGTRFEIYLPVADEEEEEVPEVRDLEMAAGWGSETILVVDDEVPVAGLAIEILKKSGYSVLVAPDGETALQIYEREGERIDLVILDLIMPGMGGSSCLEELVRMNPEVRVIVASGVVADEYRQKVLDAGARDFLRKPYEMGELLRRVRNVLDEE
jgi:two-component system cell cycle sensor histidine kinase/response regulator CckA